MIEETCELRVKDFIRKEVLDKRDSLIVEEICERTTKDLARKAMLDKMGSLIAKGTPCKGGLIRDVSEKCDCYSFLITVEFYRADIRYTFPFIVPEDSDLFEVLCPITTKDLARKAMLDRMDRIIGECLRPHVSLVYGIREEADCYSFKEWTDPCSVESRYTFPFIVIPEKGGLD